MDKVSAVTERITKGYFNAIGIRDGGKLSLSPADYISFRKLAMEEIMNGCADLFEEQPKENFEYSVDRTEYRENSVQSRKKSNISDIVSRGESTQKNISKVSASAETSLEEYEEDEEDSLMTLLKSIPG